MNPFGLRCTLCGREYSLERLPMRCTTCDEPLEYDLMPVTGGWHPEAGGGPEQGAFARYAGLLPLREPAHGVLGEGNTALIPAPRLAAKLGLGGLFFKNEAQNPTWSFKDRGTAACVLHARELGFTRLGTVSSGNMGASVAAYGAQAGFETFVVVGDIPEEKLGPIAIHGPHLIRVNAPWDVLTRLTQVIGERHDIYFTNADAPMRVEGYKTIAYELCEQLNFVAPDVVVVPTSAGGNIRGIEKGFREFHRLGLITHMPRMVAAQPLGCCPIHLACAAGRTQWERFSKPETLAGAICNAAPASGNQVLRRLSAEQGTSAAVSDPEMLAAQRALASVGLFVQPDSAAAFAAVQHLLERGEINAGSRVVCVLTASGLKFTAALGMQGLHTRDAAPEDLEACITGIMSETSLKGV